MRRHSTRIDLPALILAAIFLNVTCVPGLLGAEPPAGAELFADYCAACHGQHGEGVSDAYADPLYGDLSITALTKLIERTMPEDDPESIVGADARHVADFIYREFYSLDARYRNGLVPRPRVELVHLTVPQHRNVVADLIGRFTPEARDRFASSDDSSNDSNDDPRDPSDRGLYAEYFQSEGMSKTDSRKFRRLDDKVDFDFGEGSPGEEISADQFAIVWEASLETPKTGFYEFEITTPNGARLYVNSDPPENRRKLRDDSSVAGQAALIDAWVSSGELSEHTARVFLLGGRRYPLRLEYFKYKEPTGSITLRWRIPDGTWSVLDSQHLIASPSPRTFALDTPFPPDDGSLGYERGSAVSREWHLAANNAAIAAAAEVVNRLPLLAGLGDDTPDRDEELREFVRRFASEAFRRPLTDAETELINGALMSDLSMADAAVRRSMLWVFKSPQFLYADLTPSDEPPTQHTIAARLALILWDSLPDAALREAADNGKLQTRQQISEQARRMLSDSRARTKLRNFFAQWLEIDQRDVAKDKEKYPEFDEAVLSDLRTSLDLFLEQVVWSPESDYRQLLLADYLLLNDRLRHLYDETLGADDSESGASGATSNAFRRVVPEPGRRAGILTHPYLLSAFAYHNNSSPIHRGVFLTRNIIGRELKPPPVAVAFKETDFPADLTMREKITQLTRDTACMSCHSVINPLGFALENFDAVGRWRTAENDQPIDSRSHYVTAEGDTLEVANAQDIATYAVNSEAAHRAFVVQMFEYLVKQAPAAYGLDQVDQLQQQFEQDEFHIRNLVERIAVVAAAHNLP